MNMSLGASLAWPALSFLGGEGSTVGNSQLYKKSRPESGLVLDDGLS